jgi:hypothetical protein
VQPARGIRAVVIATAMLASFGIAAAAQEDSSSPEASLAPSVTDQLVAAFPVELLGVPLEVTAFDGDEIIAGADEGDAVLELLDVAAAHGVEMSDFSIASTSIRDDGPFVGVLAASFAGVPATDVEADLSRLILELDDGAELTSDVIAGRDVTRVGPGSGLTGESPVYVLVSDEIAWYVVATDEDLEQIVAALP